MAEVDEELPGDHEVDDDDNDEDSGDKSDGQEGEVEEVENLNDDACAWTITVILSNG